MSDSTGATDGIHAARPGDAPHSGAHDADAHADAAHGDPAHGTPLGPIDWFAWLAGLVGITAGLVVAACLYLATSL